MTDVPPWRPVRASRASDDVVAQIKQAFFGGMRPGDRLGTETDLAERFGVSRVTIRDAIRVLEAQGVVEVKVGAGGGLRIAGADPDRFADALSIQLHLAGITWAETVEAMQTVETRASRLAAQRAEPADLERLHAALADAGRRLDDPPAFTRSALDFHLLVAEAGHNRALRASVRALRAAQELRLVPDSSPERTRAVQAVHERILATIVARDPDGAEQAMRQHLAALPADPDAQV